MTVISNENNGFRAKGNNSLRIGHQIKDFLCSFDLARFCKSDHLGQYVMPYHQRVSVPPYRFGPWNNGSVCNMEMSFIVATAV
jgi:hypothetical protein